MEDSMEPLDTACERFKSFLSGLTPDYWKSIRTEADVRMKIIDRVFVEVLAWPYEEVHLESDAGSGFIDYRHTVGGLNRMITEAKRNARPLGIDPNKSGRAFKLNGPVFSSPDAKEGIEQGIRYCGHKNAELACVTNGTQWVVFRGNRLGDGKDTLDGMAYVFGNLDGVLEDFELFYNLLSFESVTDHRYRALFQEAEGQPLRTRSFRSPARKPHSRKMLPAGKLSTDLDRVMVSFFRDLTGEDDPEARVECFVTTPESSKAEATLARLSEELIGHVKTSKTDDGKELAEAIRRVQEMQRKEFVLIVGTKGSGKSTFVERFFKDVLPKDLRESTILIRVELDGCGCDSTTIIKWLDQKLLEVAEHAVFTDGPPTYDELQGMYWKEYNRWRQGPYKYDYENDKDGFKKMFGAHVDKRRDERPHEYITHMLGRVVFGLRKIPCLVFDNADHFDVPFQEEVFRYAHALYTDCLCLTLLPITDTTSWQLPRQGPFQSFYTESFFLPTPPTQIILQKRIDYIDRQISSEKPQKGRGYFTSRGIQLSIDNLQAFTQTLQKLFLQTGIVAAWIENLANHDIRRCLTLAREVVGSPYVKTDDLLKSFLEKTAMEVSPADAKLAIIRGKYDIYPMGANSFVQNVFAMISDIDTSPLLPVRVLDYVNAAWADDVDPQLRFIAVDEIIEFCRGLNFENRAIEICLDSLLKTGLCLGYDPTKKGLKGTNKIEIAPSGRLHLEWALKDWIYLESMAEVTPLLDETKCSEIRAALGDGRPHLRRSAIRSFVVYLLEEDGKYCAVPNHSSYVRQANIERNYLRVIGNCDKPVSGDGSARYVRTLGSMKAWVEAGGFGFITPDNGGPDAFVHVSEFFNNERPPNGTRVEFDLTEGTEPGKPRAINVAVLK
jgi:cold shock CspA family protein